jgi:hypothetical protein
MRKDSIAFKPSNGRDWTPERVQRLETRDVQQLRENAENLGANALVALCDAALEARPKSVSRNGGPSPQPKHARHLISRRAAFQARGVLLADAETGWSGVRKADGMVVMTLWAGAIRSGEGRCSQLLWAPNTDGSRRWSETPAGQERLKHCSIALERGAGEGFLVHGKHLGGEDCEYNARTVYGVDPESVVHFRVEQRGAEYWAVWGSKALDRTL